MAHELLSPLASDDEIIKLNVGGTLFTTRLSTLRSKPATLLGTMFSTANAAICRPSLPEKTYFMDRNPRVFSIILDYYRSGRIVLRDGVGLAELRAELDFFQVPETEWSETLSQSLHDAAAERISWFVDTLMELVEVHLQHFVDIVVIHFARGENVDTAELRNVNRSVEEACQLLLDRCSAGFRLLSDERLCAVVRDVTAKRFPCLRFSVQMIRHELLVLCLSGYLSIDTLRQRLGLAPDPLLSRKSSSS